ncbi:TetR/AcrR family transcriptional regulator [Sphingomonas sp.]|uniref:TetR/AcrR family transcriptional regulator n=1 Tax=Sphingomonas sp. TaxID=28214 RepID=UPI001EC327E8|nr:TetR/AcrR family transcriptional regulator [Sphingomonas sp.]MBX3592861.1 TetR/AcrR family transcriptional regulator [Sphingomonas sp.]
MTYDDAGMATALRAPVQGRSRASYERMLVAAEKMLASRGSDDFTLNEVSKMGKVSIGSIYNRFESKEALLHAVQLRILTRVEDKMHTRLEAARKQSDNLDSLVVRLVDAVSETLREFADLMRPLMLRATTDTIVAARGKASYMRAADEVKSALLEFRADIREPDPDRAVDTVYRVLYAAIARHLGFGSPTAAWEGDWQVLKEDLARMIALFLTTKPHF